jgi:hypothetical protein
MPATTQVESSCFFSQKKDGFIKHPLNILLVADHCKRRTIYAQIITSLLSGENKCDKKEV